MQQRHKQLAFQNSVNIYNKLNYHLKKVQPFKNKVKRTVTQQMKQYSRNQKASIIPHNATHSHLRKPPQPHPYTNSHGNTRPQSQHHPPQLQEINQQHLNRNIAVATSQVGIYDNRNNQKPMITGRKGIFSRGSSQNRLRKLDIAERGKSLKYWKVEKTEPQFVTQIKGFFNTWSFLGTQDGCNCGDNCCKDALIKWVNVSDQLMHQNYTKLLSVAYHSAPNKIPQHLLAHTPINIQPFQLYQSASQQAQLQKHYTQIQKDVPRTQTHNPFFHKPQTHGKMQRMLMCYTVQDPEVGYVQSMNIVISGVLYHIRDQVKCYAVGRKLFHQIRRIYLNDFKQCYKHVNAIRALIQQHILDLHTHLEQCGVQLPLILFPWMLSLLCVVVPLQHLDLIYTGFIKDNWKFIYRTVLALFVYHKDRIKEMGECGDILVFLSGGQGEGDADGRGKGRGDVDWVDIVRFGQKLHGFV